MKKIFSITLALIGWFAVIVQYDLMIDNRIASIPETTIRFFSFFTILTNILVAIYMTYQSIRTATFNVRLLDKAGSLTAITVYITIVGLVYQVALRHIWNPQGMARVVDELLHTVIPFLVIIYWFINENKKDLSFKFIPTWLIYPFCYLVCILIRGAYANYYPYPFIDVTSLGLQHVLINAILLIVFFIGTSAAFIFISKKVNHKQL